MDEKAVEQRWEELLRAAEHSASRRWLDRPFVPLSTNVPDFQVRRLQALAAARSLVSESRATDHALVAGSDRQGCEVAVSTPDGTLAGRIDVVSESPTGPVLKDYKSGAIYGHTGAGLILKPEYETQLKLYAAMYEAMTGRWPAGLELLPISGDSVPVTFSHEECTELLAEATRLRNGINAIIDSDRPEGSKAEELAAPTAAACSFCPYRPRCAPYAEARSRHPEEAWPADAAGVLTERRLLGNGRLFLSIEVDAASIVHIRGVSADPQRHPALPLAQPGDFLAAFNLRIEGSPTTLGEGRYTTFYARRSTRPSD